MLVKTSSRSHPDLKSPAVHFHPPGSSASHPPGGNFSRAAEAAGDAGSPGPMDVSMFPFAPCQGRAAGRTGWILGAKDCVRSLFSFSVLKTSRFFLLYLMILTEICRTLAFLGAPFIYLTISLAAKMFFSARKGLSCPQGASRVSSVSHAQGPGSTSFQG